MLKIWGHRRSSCVQKALWACDELGLAFERYDVGGSLGGLDEPDYAALNPNAVIPTLDDGGFVLWESSAILCYLADRYGVGTLSPTDPTERGEAYRWTFWQGTTLRPVMLPLYGEWTAGRPEFRHLTSAYQKTRAATATWRILDAHLADRSYVAGDAFSMGDIPVGIMAHWWYDFPVDHAALPERLDNVRRWYDALLERPAFRRRVVDMVD